MTDQLNQPNDVIVRVTKDGFGEYSHEILLGANNDEMLPELRRVAYAVEKALDQRKTVLDMRKPKIVIA